jgi:aspartyl-tRNA(Asn)/glutamyl-tRNA(Gln) amidotransferase subunit A
MHGPARLTIARAGADLRAGRCASIDLVDASLAAIDRHQAATNAFVVVHADAARAAAETCDRERRAGVDRGPLHGIPISLKDLIDVAGGVTTAGSRVLRDRVATADATVVDRLRRAGAIVIGRTNLHEFALGTTSEDSAFGPVRHPMDPQRVAGGSSGGSAAAVATGMGLASIGTDTGGSVRIPAAACGVVGLKPSRADVPTDGVIPLSRSLDHVGPLTVDVADAATLWRLLSDTAATSEAAIDPHALRLTAIDAYFDLIAPEVRFAFDRAMARLREGGVSIAPGAIAGTEAITTAYVNVVLPEAAAWHAPYLDARAGDYTPTVLARLQSGRDIRAVDYLAAKDTQIVLQRAVDAVLETADALILPTLPIVAPPLGSAEVDIDPDRGTRLPVRAAMLRHTQLFNMTGHPAISLPIGARGLPVGLQIVGRLGATARLLAIAAICEKIVGSP